jgi:hypothetical protein
MFWGYVLKDQKSLNMQKLLEESDYPVLHISHVGLPKGSASSGKVYLTASSGKEV